MTTIESVIKEMRECGSSMVGEFRVSDWADRLEAEVRKGPVAWMWEYIGPDAYVRNSGQIARLTTEMDPANPPYPDTWRPVCPLFAAPQPAIPTGWQLVPVEPTQAMMEIGGSSCGTARNGRDPLTARGTYRAMLAAAPKPPTGEGEV